MPRPKKTPAATTFLTIADLVTRWQISENNVRAIVRQKGLETRPSPRVIRIRLADLERYEAEQAQSSGA